MSDLPPFIASHQWAATQEGPYLLVFGAIHGNETCGPVAMATLKDELTNGSIPLLRGTLTFVPICNPAAHAQNTRFIEENLNRVFCPHTPAASYEAKLANVLTRYVDACDVLLDLHTMTTTGGAFTFLDRETPAFTDFVMAQGIPTIVRGWQEVQSAADSINESDTVGYACSKGKIGTVVECGQHGAPEAVAVARQCILASLAYLEMIPPTYAAPALDKVTNIRVTRAVFRKGEGQLTRPWVHLDPVQKGEVIATYADGSQEVAESAGFILLPKAITPLGHEWFYLGVQE